MSNESNSSLNIILGQLEDELRAIKSARDQADSVVSANSELSAKLERVVIETKGLIEKSNDQTRVATESLSGEVSRMSEQAEAIKDTAIAGTEAIKKQATEAQVALEETAGTIASTLSIEVERLTDHLRVMEESSTGIASAIQKQASDAQSAIERAANNAVGKASSKMSGLAEQAMSKLNDGIANAKDDINTASESAKAAASDIKANSDALLQANNAASSANQRQSEEIKMLLGETRGHLADIDASIATLKEIDVSALEKEIRELKTIEASNTENLKSKLTTVTIIASASVAACLATLVKLLLG